MGGYCEIVCETRPLFLQNHQWRSAWPSANSTDIVISGMLSRSSHRIRQANPAARRLSRQFTAGIAR